MTTPWTGRGPAGGFGTAADYPFVRPSPDVRGRFADLHLVHSEAWARLPLRVVHIASLDQPVASSSWQPSADVDASSSWTPAQGGAIAIVDADDYVVFNGEAVGIRYTRRPWGGEAVLHRWVGVDAACMLFERRPLAPEMPPTPAELWPTSAVIDPRCVDLAPRQLRQIEVAGRTVGPGGSLRLEMGHNTTVTARPATTGLRQTTEVAIEAERGFGLGLYPGCEHQDAVRSLAGATPGPTGDVQLVGDDCHQVGFDDDGSLVVANQCGPCCRCSEFDDVQMRILALHARLKTHWGRAKSIVGLLDSASGAMGRYFAETYNPVQLNLVPHDGHYVTVQAWLHNHSALPISDAAILFLLGRGDDVAAKPITLVPGTAYSSNDGVDFQPCQMRATRPVMVADAHVGQELSGFEVSRRSGESSPAGIRYPDDPWTYVGFIVYFESVPPATRAAARFTVDVPGTDPATVRAFAGSNVRHRISTGDLHEHPWMRYGMVSAHASPR